MRSYIRAVQEPALERGGQIVPGSDLANRLLWAGRQADRPDPLAESPPSILDEKE